MGPGHRARGVTEEEAAEFFSYVAALCLQDTDDPFNPEAWIGANVVSGGQVFAQGAEFSVYGTQEERMMQVVAAGNSRSAAPTRVVVATASVEANAD